MSVTSARRRIQSEYKDLMVAWIRAGESWRDPGSRAFEERRLRPLDRRLKAAATAMEHLEGELAKARRDCGDD